MRPSRLLRTLIALSAMMGTGLGCGDGDRILAPAPDLSLRSPAAVGRIAVTPASADLEVRETQQFQATVYDPQGHPITVAVSWSSSNPAVATVAASGVAKALAPGITVIVASAQGITGSAALEVFPASQIAWLPGLTKQLHVMTGLGKNPHFVADKALGNGPPSWSADRVRLVYTHLAGIGPDLWIAKANGAGSTQLTSGADHEGGAIWSPDGTRIAFGRSYLAGGSALMTITPDGASTTTVISGNGGVPSDWSPDGGRLVLSLVNGSQNDIHIVNADGTGLINLSTDASSLDYDADWSPNGSRIAFAREPIPPLNGSSIYVMNTDGSGKTKLIDGERPRWSPDGSRILLERGNDLYVVDANGGNLVQLTNSPETQEDQAQWSPDGGRIAFRQFSVAPNTDPIGEIYVIKSDGSKRWNLTNSPLIDDVGLAWRP